MSPKSKKVLYGFLLLILLAAGCSDQTTTSPTTTSPSVQITPANGATNVKLDATVTVDFGKAVTTMDRMMVQSGMHLIAESDMDSLCPYYSTHHDDMDSVMNDPDMMHHMDQYHSTIGHYSWNPAGTACAFHADSLMHPGTRYMVHVSGTMLHHTMGMGSPTTGSCYTNSAGDVMTHFQTTRAQP